MRFRAHLSVAILINNIWKVRKSEDKIDRVAHNTIVKLSRYISKFPGVEKPWLRIWSISAKFDFCPKYFITNSQYYWTICSDSQVAVDTLLTFLFPEMHKNQFHVGH